MLAFAQLAGSAFIGVLVGLLVQWWKSSRDELRLLCDEFAKTVRDTSDLGSSYWLSTPADAAGSRLTEVRVVGLQRQLDGYRVLIGRRFLAQARSHLDAATAEFFDAMTGADFMTPSRKENGGQASQAQACGAALILAVREGFATSVSMRATIRHYWRRFSPRPKQRLICAVGRGGGPTYRPPRLLGGGNPRSAFGGFRPRRQPAVESAASVL
jgi:hypothetical protein